MIHSEAVTAVVLCGGEGRRMGGRDKGLVLWQGQPLGLHVLRAVEPQVDHCLISANRHLSDYAAWGYPVLPDTSDGFQGPLAGVCAALVACSTPWLLVVPCDTPRIPPDLARRLLQAAHEAQAPAAWVAGPQRDHPVIHVVHRTLLSQLQDWHAAGGRAVRHWLAHAGAVPARFPDEACFANFNTSAALDEPGSAPLR